VRVNRQTGAIRCTRFYVAHDCGQIINPDDVRAQIEGNIIQTVSRTLKEELRWNRSRVTSVDWASYPILRFAEVPEVVMELISRPTEPPWGGGRARRMPAGAGDLQRRLRRDRRAPAQRAVHARALSSSSPAISAK
jgi:CO/xanthine dehydrogenase Mo-binding subunit